MMLPDTCAASFCAVTQFPYLADYLAQHYDLNTAHSQAVTDEWTRCAAFTQQILPVCEDNARRYTCEKLDEFSPGFADCR